MVGARKLDAGCITDIGRRDAVARLYWAADEASVVPVDCSGGGLSFAGADTMTVRVVVDVRPEVRDLRKLGHVRD